VDGKHVLTKKPFYTMAGPSSMISFGGVLDHLSQQFCRRYAFRLFTFLPYQRSLKHQLFSNPQKGSHSKAEQPSMRASIPSVSDEINQRPWGRQACPDRLVSFPLIPIPKEEGKGDEEHQM